MSKLSELDSAVRKLNDLWVVCPDPDQKEKTSTSATSSTPWQGNSPILP